MRYLTRALSLLAALQPLPPMLLLSAAPQTFRRTRRPISVSRYSPHQGKRECARRLAQLAKIEARQA